MKNALMFKKRFLGHSLLMTLLALAFFGGVNTDVFGGTNPKEIVAYAVSFQPLDNGNIRIIFNDGSSVDVPKSQAPEGTVVQKLADGSIAVSPPGGVRRVLDVKAEMPSVAVAEPGLPPSGPEAESAQASAVFDAAKAPDGAAVPSVVSGSDLVSKAFADEPVVEEPADKAPAPEVNGGGQAKQKGKPFKALGKWASDNIRALVAGGVAGALVGGIFAIATYGAAITLATALNPLLIGAAVGAGLFFLITNINKFMK